MPDAALTPDQYLAGLPPERQQMVGAIRDTINGALSGGYQEGIQYGMIGWSVPHAAYQAGYHCDPKQPVPFIGLASKKEAVTVHLFGMYMSPQLKAWFEDEYQKTGHRLDMGAGCIRFKKPAQVPLELIGELVRRLPMDTFLALYEASKPAPKKKR